MSSVVFTKVVARKDRVKLHNAIIVSLLQATKSCVVEIAGVAGNAVAICDNPTVHSGCIAVPDIHVDGRHRLASRSVNDLYIKSQRNALLTIGDVPADQLASDIVGALRALWLKNA